MSSEQYSKITENLKQVSDRQEEYRKMYIANQEQNSASECVSVSDSLHAHGRFITDISEMISLIKVTVEDISKKIKENEKKIDDLDLEQYSSSNCLILHGCHNAPTGPDVSNQVFKDFVIGFLNSKLNLPSAVSRSDIDICHTLPSKKGKNPIIIKFVRRSMRNTIFHHKADLKSTSGPKYSITESLTKRRLKILEEARKVFEFRNAWSLKGDIYCNFARHKYRIDYVDDIDKICNSNH